MNNKQLGNEFEAELCQILYSRGFWVHNLAQNQAGQPADILAIRNKQAYLIDCKVCSGKGFPLSRVEENQKLAMELWKECGNGQGWFALKMGEQVYMIPHIVVMMFALEKSIMSPENIFYGGTKLELWVTRCK